MSFAPVAARAISLLIVDASEIVRQGIRAILNQHAAGEITVCAEVAALPEAVQAIKVQAPDVALLDSDSTGLTGGEGCRQLLQSAPNLRVIVMATMTTDRLVYEALTSGALGYITKTISGPELVQAIRNVADGNPIFDREGTDGVLRLLRSEGGSTGPQLSRLSVQERRVLALVAQGMTNKQVGAQLRLSRNTVKNYLVAIFEKLQVKRRAHAAAIFVQETHANGE
jgi:two-component system, NarL family, response regulator DevR